MKKWAFILCLGLVSCYTEQKAKHQFTKAAIAYPIIATEYCAEQFPDKADSVIVKTDTVIDIQFLDSLVYDSLYFDTSNCKPITILKTKTVTIRKDSIIYRPNLAEQERLNLMLIDCQRNNNVLVSKLDEKDALIADWKKKARQKGWMFWGLIFLVIGAIGTRLYLKSKSIIKT